MGRRGPAPQPAAVKKARGNPGKRKIGAEPPIEKGAPSCPAWLSTPAKSVWAQVVEDLARSGILALADGNTLARYCEQFVLWKRAAAVVAKKGPTYESVNTKGASLIVQRPEVRLVRDLSTALLRIEQEFGMTPSARSRIHIEPAAEEADPMASLLDGKK